MKSLALGAIRFYQRFLSQHKGFCCAYASVTGHASCSALGYRTIRRYGVWRGIALLDQRLAKCGVAYRRHRPKSTHRALGRQGGFIDCACDAPGDCSLPSDGLCDCNWPRIPNMCDCLSGCGGGDCDWRRRKKKDDNYVVIPARGNV